MKKIIDNVYLIDSWNQWPITSIMWGIHWDERSWIISLTQQLESLQINKGKIYIIFWNPLAIEKNVRYIDKNLNRCFQKTITPNSYEEKRAKEIILFLTESDYLLDIHNTINNINSIPFLISEYPELWKLFDVDYIINWLDVLHPWWTDWYMNSIWKIGICLEVGSIYDTIWVDFANKAINNFLKYTWNINWDIKIYNNKQVKINFNYIYKNESLKFTFLKDYKDFQYINNWETIAIDWDKTIIAKENSIILFATNPKNIWDECYILGKIIN